MVWNGGLAQIAVLQIKPGFHPACLESLQGGCSIHRGFGFGERVQMPWDGGELAAKVQQ